MNFENQLNFIDKTILDVLTDKLKEGSILSSQEEPYLPFLAEVFQKDIKFLSQHSQYLLAEFKHFLTFYGFIYCAQLSLSIGDWRSGTPKAKPLYFILDTEKASSERVEVNKNGYKWFHEASFKLFPLLSMLENLQPDTKDKVPLWKIVEKIKQYSQPQEVAYQLKVFADSFKRNRALGLEFFDSDSPIDWIDNLMALAVDQFRAVYKDRADVNDNYVRELLKHFGTHFIQKRGRAGQVLVLSQDYLLLLTNLVIGNQNRLQFHELIKGFQSRGVFVDRQTEQALIEFYERIGNVERMSDSGDAVYVRKTV